MERARIGTQFLRDCIALEGAGRERVHHTELHLRVDAALVLEPGFLALAEAERALEEVDRR